MDDALEFTYSIVNLGVGLQPVKDRSIRVRIFTDDGSEHILQRELSACGITNFKADALLRERSTGHLGTDHFTGG